jgi:integrase
MKKGSIKKRGENSWQVRFDTTPAGGKRVTRYFTIRGSKADAEAALIEKINAANKGQLPDANVLTVGAYAQDYLQSALNLSPKTRERYGELLRLQLAPHLGEKRLTALKPEDVERWHSQLAAKGLSPRTIGHAHRLLSTVLKRGVKNRKLVENVAALVKMPKSETEVQILSADMVSTVLASLKGQSLYPIVALAVSTGCRRGELLALKWSDFDAERAVLRIEKSVEETRAGLRLKPTKTKRGRRNVKLSSDAVAMLVAHEKRCLEQRLKIGQGGRPQFIFGTLEDTLRSPNALTRHWHRALDLAGLPMVSFHSLRHYHASTLIRAGVDILTISRRLGHSTAAITLNVYGHLSEGADAAAALAIEGVLN